MEKAQRSRPGLLLDKLAVPSEPGLTNAQLMLTNYDLKPGQWKLWTEAYLLNMANRADSGS